MEDFIIAPENSQYYAAYGAVLYGLELPPTAGAYLGLDQLEQYVDDMDDDLANLEEAVFDGLNDEDLDEKAPDGHSMLVSFADVTCPHCGLHFFVDEDFWAAQDVVDVDCPNCHESVEVSKSGLNPSH